jgi:hypothetical protein
MITEDKKRAVRAAIDEFIFFINERSVSFIAERHPGIDADTYQVDGGRKYLRIVGSRVGGGGRYVHCFIDAQTGGVYKAAGWKAPALNGERYNLLDPESFAELKAKWDAYGSYLYKR